MVQQRIDAVTPASAVPPFDRDESVDLVAAVETITERKAAVVGLEYLPEQQIPIPRTAILVYGPLDGECAAFGTTVGIGDGSVRFTSAVRSRKSRANTIR
jgi:hypothetical protein